MRGDPWTLTVAFVFIAFLPGVLAVSGSAPGLSGDLASLFGSISAPLALTAFVATMAAVVSYIFGNPFGGGGF